MYNRWIKWLAHWMTSSSFVAFFFGLIGFCITFNMVSPCAGSSPAGCTKKALCGAGSRVSGKPRFSVTAQTDTAPPRVSSEALLRGVRFTAMLVVPASVYYYPTDPTHPFAPSDVPAHVFQCRNLTMSNYPLESSVVSTLILFQFPASDPNS